MERLLLCALVLCSLARAQLCPKRCMCQNLSPSLAILCTKTGLLFVPTVIDRRTVELRLTDNFITVVRRKDFTNMTSLVHLTLSRNTISQILPFAFADLRGLRALHLDNNRLLSIGGDQLKGLPNLRHLILSNNQLQDISPGAFDDFAGTLEDLDLSYNNLVQVPWETIRRLHNVNSLSLDHNLIDFVPEGVFSNLLKLARLDMTSNKLKKIPPDPLFLRIPVYAKSKGSPLSSLVLSFGGNPLHCNCELLWLRRLTREDDLETCASPPDLLGKYFWTIPEEEFICEPPVITRHTGHLVVTEGEGAVLRCRGVGDPEPSIHWVSPEGKVVANTSRTVSYENGTLEILIATVQDTGAFTCIASNAAGDATTSIELVANPLPHLSNSTAPKVPEAAGPSDILTSAKAVLPAGANETGAAPDKGVVASEVSSSSVLIHWYPQWHVPGIRMYQIQYNSSSDDTLVYRMIPSSSKAFLVKDLTSGRDYNLCVLAVYDDGVTSLTATRSLGCVRFSTLQDAPQCHSLHTQFLGGTMIIIIGGIIVASVLVFIIILMIRYKVYSGQEEHKKAKVSNVYSQTNGSQPPPAPTAATALPHSPSKLGEDKYETLQEVAPKEALLSGDIQEGSPTCQDMALTEVDKRAVRMAVDLQTVAILSAEAGPLENSMSGSSVSLCLTKDTGTGPQLRTKLGSGGAGVLPRELSRTHHHRHSFDGDYSLFQSHSYPRRARTKRHMSTSQLNSEECPLSERRVTFSSTEWMLESTV